MTSTFPVTADTTATRHTDRMTYDRSLAYAVLDEAVICHVGFVVDGKPVVLPQLHARDGDHLILHGSTGARALRAARSGLQVCVTVTLVDGLVLARSAFNHSINYRSVVVHGTAEVIGDEDAKRHALARLVDAVVPDRSQHVRGPSKRELASTTVLRVPLEQVSVKVRTGPPGDDEEDFGLPYWAGVLPLGGPAAGAPESDPTLDPTIDVPQHVTAWRRG